jgi:hypothetical protein
MIIKFKRNGKTVYYTDEELHRLSRENLKHLKGEIQSNIMQISARKEQYILNNEENCSKEYWAKIAQYKSITVKLNDYIVYINHILDTNHESELHKREHWFWTFYMNVKKNTRKGKFEKIIKMTDEHVKYHIEVGE